MSFDRLGLSTEILRAIADQGYTQPTEIQQRAIPEILKGQDLLACAQTGTGKTAGFTLPMLELLGKHPRPKKRRERKVKGLVLTPTRELAAQVGKSLHTYGRKSHLKAAVIYGGVKFYPQIHSLRSGVDMVVATPGRLLDHVQRGNLDLTSIEYFVLDEADRMLDMGFIDDIKKIMSYLPEKRQNLLFSATYSREIKALAASLLVDPVSVEIETKTTTPERVNQRIFPVPRKRKRDLLSHIITNEELQRVLVFTRTRHGADDLAKQLVTDGISATSIHGDKTQNARMKALKKFKNGHVRALVATDVAARGLDIDDLSHVVNFDLCHVPEDYVHRIGRTGRAGRKGDAISLVSSDERRMLRQIERHLKMSIPKETIPGFEPDFSFGSDRQGKSRGRKPGFPSENKPWQQRKAAPKLRPEQRARRAAEEYRRAEERNEKTGLSGSVHPKPSKSRFGKAGDKPWAKSLKRGKGAGFGSKSRWENAEKSERGSFKSKPRWENAEKSERGSFKSKPRWENAEKSERRPFKSKSRWADAEKSERGSFKTSNKETAKFGKAKDKPKKEGFKSKKGKQTTKPKRKNKSKVSSQDEPFWVRFR